MTEASAEILVKMTEKLEQLANVNPPPKPDDFNADGTRKKPSEDTIVTEGEVCK